MEKKTKTPKIINWKRRCNITGQGLNDGWFNFTCAIYIKYEDDAVKTVKDFGFKSLQHAYDEGFIYWTDWSQDEDEYFSYSENGKAYELEEWEEYKSLKTVVIHPSDSTTMFLRPVYEHKGWDLINQHVPEKTLSILMAPYDFIIGLGHGTPGSLLSLDGVLLSSAHVPIIRDKKFISIWCNSDMFVKYHQLDPQLYTGMIVSEVAEARVYSLPTNQDLVDESNELFASALEQFIEYPYPAELIKSVYKSDTNPIIQFNRQRIYS